MHDGMSQLSNLLFCHCPGYVALHLLNLDLVMNLHFSRNKPYLLTKCCSYVSIHFINQPGLIILPEWQVYNMFGILVRRRLALLLCILSHMFWCAQPLVSITHLSLTCLLVELLRTPGRRVGEGWATSG
jgi:hypothetical protein